jgi:hypothetical protein
MKIFISYAREDFEIADGLSAVLRAEGHRVFFDTDRRSGIPHGELFDKKIRQEIGDCRLFIFLVSPFSIEAGYARAELNIATERFAGYSSFKCRILPVEIKEIDRLPQNLRLNILKIDGDAIPEIANRVAICQRGRRRRYLQAVVLGITLLLISAAAFGGFLWYRSEPQPCELLMSSQTESDALAFFKGKANARGFSNIQPVDSWCGDWMFYKWLDKEMLTGFLRQKAATGEKGDLLIGIWQSSSVKEEHSWNIGSMLSEPNVHSIYRQTVVQSPGLETNVDPTSTNERTLSIVERTLVLGTYAGSFDEATSKWICSNFSSSDIPFAEIRPQNDNMDWRVIKERPGCPEIKFLATKGSKFSDVALFRQLLNLTRAPDANNTKTTDTVYISTSKNTGQGSRDSSSKAVPIRVFLLWAQSGP